MNYIIKRFVIECEEEWKRLYTPPKRYTFRFEDNKLSLSEIEEYSELFTSSTRVFDYIKKFRKTHKDCYIMSDSDSSSVYIYGWRKTTKEEKTILKQELEKEKNVAIELTNAEIQRAKEVLAKAGMIAIKKD